MTSHPMSDLKVPPEVEKVARAIYEKRNGAGCRPWARLLRSHQEPYREDALAAMEAMMEPSREMVEAAYSHATRPTIPGYWQAMLSRAMGR